MVISMKNGVKGHGIVPNIIWLLGLAYRNYKIVFLFIVVEMLCGGLLPLFGLYLPKLAVELVLEGGGFGRALSALAGFASVYLLLQCAGSVASQGKYPFQNNLRMLCMQLLYYKALDCDYALMEASEGQTWYEKARAAINNGDGAATSQSFEAVTRFVSGAIAFSVIFGIISGLNPYILALLVALSALNYLLDSFAIKYELAQQDTTADLRKKSYYIERAMADTRAAKDIRIYELASLFSDVRDRLLRRMFDVYTRIGNRRFLSDGGKLLVTVIRDGAAYAYCIGRVDAGDITVPDFILFMGAIASFSAWLNRVVSDVAVLRRENARVNELRAFFDYTNRLDPVDPLPADAIGRPVDIEFRNVGFRYTEDTPKVLDGLSFHIRANEKAALVGVNGAGKTTIVKLLCGFYKASEGEILLNGLHIDRFRRADLCTLFSAVFQDICILPVTVGENITFVRSAGSKQGAAGADEERLLRCLEVAGIKDEIMRHELGLGAPMLKSIVGDGVVLSGGQQQKLLLARALYKDAPLLILDEPTAALDPIAESEVYEKFHEVTADKTALYISHRLASTRFCDTILMLKDGRIVESGSHAELVAKNGEYAYMYDIQSHYYKRDAGSENDDEQ